VTAEQQATANKCRHARLGYLDGQPGTWDDIVARLRDLDHAVRWWQRLAERLLRQAAAFKETPDA
jgi:hypothetical protein